MAQGIGIGTSPRAPPQFLHPQQSSCSWQERAMMLQSIRERLNHSYPGGSSSVMVMNWRGICDKSQPRGPQRCYPGVARRAGRAIT